MKIRNIAPLQDVPMKLGVVDAKKFSVQFAYSGDLTKLLTFMRLIELDNKTTFMPIPNLKINASGTFDLSLIVTTVLLPDVISTEIPAGQEEEEEEEED